MNLEEQAKELYKSWFINFNDTNNIMPADLRIVPIKDIVKLHDSKRVSLSKNERAKLE